MKLVHTEAGLDLLPLDTIIRDREGALTKGSNDPRYPGWYVGDNALEVKLPALVLWEPEDGTPEEQ